MTVDELLAREAIRLTLARYAGAVDRGDFDAVLATFTPDAVYEPVAQRPACHGHAGIHRFLRALGAAFRNSPTSGGLPPKLAHHLTTSQVDVRSTSEATGFTRFVAIGPHGPDHTGFYLDRLVPCGGSWLLAHRRIVIDWLSPASLVPAVLEGMDDR